MGTCVVLIVLAWNVVRFWSTPAAVADERGRRRDPAGRRDHRELGPRRLTQELAEIFSISAVVEIAGVRVR